MRVKNTSDHGVFVASHGVVAAGDEATVRDSPSVQELIKAGVLKEPKATDKQKEGDRA